jgi:hypothetical protein
LTFECWPRFSDVKGGRKAQFTGWPVTVSMDDNDGRRPVAWLPEMKFSGVKNPVVQVASTDTREILYTIRVPGTRFQPPVFAHGNYIVRVGRDRPDGPAFSGLEAKEEKAAGSLAVKF